MKARSIESRLLKKRQAKTYGGLRLKTWRDVIYLSTCIALTITVTTHMKADQSYHHSPIIASHAAEKASDIQPTTGTFLDIFKPFTLLGTTPTPTVTQAPVKKTPPVLAEPDQNWDTFVQTAKTIAPLYQYPINVLLSQAALESNRGQSEYARSRNNYFGIAAYDWNPDDASRYDDQAECIIAYIELIKHNFPQAWASRNDPDALVNLLESNDYGIMYATDPDYAWKLHNVPEWGAN